MASEPDRIRRIEALEQAVRIYAKRQRETLRKRIATNRQILQGRGAADRLSAAAVDSGAELVVQEIDDFLRS